MLWNTIAKVLRGPRPQDLLPLVLFVWWAVIFTYNHDKPVAKRLSTREYEDGKKKADSEKWLMSWVQALPWGLLFGWVLFACRAYICSATNQARKGCKKSTYLNLFMILLGGFFLFRVGEIDTKVKNQDSFEWYLTPIVIYSVLTYMAMHYLLNRTPGDKGVGVKLSIAGLVALTAVVSQGVLCGYEIDHNNKGTDKNWQNTTMRVVAIFVTLFVVCSLWLNIVDVHVPYAGKPAHDGPRLKGMDSDLENMMSGPGGVGMGSSYTGIDI